MHNGHDHARLRYMVAGNGQKGEKLMHAVVVRVTVHDAETAQAALQEQTTMPPGDAVTLDDVEVREVVASA